MTGFTLLFFDHIGKPYNVYVDEGDPGNAPLNSDLDITVSVGGQNRNIKIIPETGLTQ
jgi:hypothetical protein